jgi:hypothetical protein
MATTVANTTICPALAGQDALITISYTSYATNSAAIFLGQKATNVASKIGYISEIVPGGTQFKVKPQYPSTRFDTAGTPGQLAAENISLG